MFARASSMLVIPKQSQCIRQRYVILLQGSSTGGDIYMSEQTIKSIRVYQYGGPEQLRLERIERPVPQAGEVLVRVHAAGVNPADWKILQGSLQHVFPRSFPYTPGLDLAGIVEEVGPGVTAFERGQAVFGRSTNGTYAEYATASIKTLALKPRMVSFDEAAAIPGGATTAWQTLFEDGGLQAGERVLIQGAAGGVGLFAVQFAKLKGAYVIGTTSTPNVDFVRSLGADEVLDYTSPLPENTVHDVDLVLNTVGGETLESSLSILKRGGTLISIAGRPPQEKAQQLGVRAVAFYARYSNELLSTFAHLIDEGQVKVVVRQTFPLSEVRQAHERCQQGHGRGRIVLHIAD
jgi:NADPH:quinone reductase-like Zn-dependent oxidoreductase